MVLVNFVENPQVNGGAMGDYMYLRRFARKWARKGEDNESLMGDLLQAGYVKLLEMRAANQRCYAHINNAMRECIRKYICAVDIPRELKSFRPNKCVSFDVPVHVEGGEVDGYEYYGNSAPDPEFRRREANMMVERLFETIQQLTPQQRAVLSLRFEEPEHTQVEVSQKMGISRTRVAQIEKKVLEILREALEDKETL